MYAWLAPPQHLEGFKILGCYQKWNAKTIPKVTSLNFQYVELRHIMDDQVSIRVRIDSEGYTHVTVTQWDEDGRDIVYCEDENFQCKAREAS